MNDKDFLNWIADRFVHVHGESENVDFVQRLRKLAAKTAYPEECNDPVCPRMTPHYRHT